MHKKKVALSLSAILVANIALADETKVLKDMTVTAQKTEQRLQEIPMSVNALNAYDIKDASINQTRDIEAYIPNFVTSHTGTRDYFSKITIRGISNTGIGDPAAALYIDGVSYANLYAFNSPLFDVERIEVLKGAQGTLWGKNTEAGVINIVTKEPSNNFAGKVGLQAGDNNKRSINTIINTPLIDDKVILRLSGIYDERDGFIKNIHNQNTIGDEKTTNLRANFLIKPTDRLKLNLILGYSDMEDKGGFPMLAVDKEKYSQAIGIKGLKDFQTANDYNGDSSAKTLTSALKTIYEFDNFDLTSVTTYRDTDNKSTLDADFTLMPLYIGFNELENKSFAQELRLHSDKDSSFKWLIGTYFSDDDQHHETGYLFDKIIAEKYKMPLYTKDKISADLLSRDMAIFGQSTMRFFDDKFGVTLGARFEDSKRELQNRTHTTANKNTVSPVSKKTKNKNFFLPKLSLDYKFNNDFMVYTTASKGYKAGGFSFAVDNPALSEYDPEFSKSVEIGAKTYFSDIGLLLNVAAFYTKVEDYQDRLQLDAITILQANVGEVDIKGFEIEMMYNFLQNFTLNGNIGYTDAKYGDYINPTTKENYRDNSVALIPKIDTNLELKYTHPIGIFASFGMQGLGSKYADRENQKKLSSTQIYNAKIGYEKDNFDIYLGVKNMGDKEYYLDGFNMGEMGYLATVGNGREIVLEFNYRF